MSDVTIYHNPRCSKSRETLSLLKEKGVEPTVVEYLNQPLDAAGLKEVLGKLGIAPRALLRTKESEYKEAGLDDMTKSDDDVIAAMVQYPRLMERPLVVKGDKAALGRPPVQVLEIL